MDWKGFFTGRDDFLRDPEQLELRLTSFETYGDLTVGDTLVMADTVTIAKNVTDPVVTVGYHAFLD